jgi:carbon dioxide concentrating mechanism protein CcmL
MYLGKVIGRIVCSIKDSSLESRTLLLVRRLPKGPVVVAVDAVGAGAGETVYVCRGKEASFAFLPDEVPTEATIVAIVDQVYRALPLPLGEADAP